MKQGDRGDRRRKETEDKVAEETPMQNTEEKDGGKNLSRETEKREGG